VDPAPTGPASDSLEDVEETRSENSRKLALAPGVCALAVAHGPSDWIERQVDQVIGVVHRVQPRDLDDLLVAEVLAQLPPKLRIHGVLKALLDLLPLLMALSLMLLHRRARRRPEPLPSFLIMMMSNFEPLGVRLWAI
jgi:hypothetical protein